MQKILVIEDDILVRENVQTILELENFEVFTAGTGEEAIQKINSNKLDLILCDVMLPDMEGFDILDRISKKENVKNIPFIFLTARSEMQDLRKGMNLGADDYITKPFHINELLKVINIRLEKSKNRNPSKNNNEEIDKHLKIDDHIFLPTGSEVQFIVLKNIECIISEGVYTYVHTVDSKKILIRKLLKQWENVLPLNNFVRIHKSTIININRINKVEKWFSNSYRIQLKTFTEPLIISRRYAAKLKNQFNF